MISPLWTTLTILILLLTLPLTSELTLLTLALFLRRRPRPSVDIRGMPFRLAVIVPAHNEAANIGSAVHSLKIARAQLPKAEIRILVIAHNCTDATAGHAKQAGAEVRILDADDETVTALGFAFGTVPADGYLVLGPRTIVDPELIDAVQARLAAGADAIQCHTEALSDLTLRSRFAAILLRADCVLRPRRRQRLGLSCGLLDDGFALSRSLLDRIPYSASSATEFHFALVQAGVHVRYLEGPAVRRGLAETPSQSVLQSVIQFGLWRNPRLVTAWRAAPWLALQMLSGVFRLFEPTLNLIGLPFSPQTLLLLVGLFFPNRAFHRYCFFSLTVLALHMLAAALDGEEPLSELRALLYAPVYLVRQIGSVPSIFRAAWKSRAVKLGEEVDPQ